MQKICPRPLNRAIILTGPYHCKNIQNYIWINSRPYHTAVNLYLTFVQHISMAHQHETLKAFQPMNQYRNISTTISYTIRLLWRHGLWIWYGKIWKTTIRLAKWGTKGLIWQLEGPQKGGTKEKSEIKKRNKKSKGQMFGQMDDRV